MIVKKEEYEKKGFIILDKLGKYEIQDYSLESNVVINIFGKQYNIFLRINYVEKIEDGWEISEELIEYAKKFLNGINIYLEKAMYEIEQYYHTTIKDEAAEGFCEYVEIKERNSINQFLTPYILDITKSDIGMIKLVFQCDWYEDEFMVKYDNDCNIEEVGALW